MNVLELKSLTKRYGDFAAVDGVSLELEKGKVLSLLGPSGCGKTTTLRIIAGFTSPDGGSVHIAGADVGRLKPYERNVGLLFQDYALFPHMTVAQNVAYGMRYRGTPAVGDTGARHADAVARAAGWHGAEVPRPTERRAAAARCPRAGPGDRP